MDQPKTDICQIGNPTCAPCAGAGGVLADPAARMAGLHPDWQIEGTRILRRFAFRNFARAAQMANLAAYLGESAGHHPDVAFGWGWCQIAYTSHEAGGLTEADFTAAERLDRIV